MSKVRYEPESLILPAEGVLYVVNRRGIFNIRARNIHRLHETLKPHLDGTHDEAALLASVPESQQPTIRHYLSKLREAHALRETDANDSGATAGEAPTPAARAAVGDGRTWTAATPSGKSVFVSLDGARRDATGRHDACIFFVTPEQARRELLTLDYWRGRACAVVYVLAAPTPRADDDDAAEALRRRAQYARWLLLTSESLLEQRDAVALYGLDEEAGTLVRLLVTQDSPSALRRVPAQLELINVADVAQVPLVVARAAHALFPLTITRMGLHYEALYEDLAREFGARAVLAEYALGPAPHFPAKVLDGRGPKPRPARVPVDAVSVESWQVAGSLLQLRARLLEQYADALKGPDGLSAREGCDLLEAEPEHADVRQLVETLRLRVTALPARVTETAAGLFVYECLGRRGVSFLRARAARDLLLLITWDTFYGGDAAHTPTPALQFDYEAFVTDGELRRIVSEREAELTGRYGAVRLLYRKIRCWGRTAWAGYLERETPGDR